MGTDRLIQRLADLEREWRLQGAPVAEKAAPGLTDAQIDVLMAPVGIDLPDELRAWWRWHNGLVEDGTDYGFGPTFDFGSVGPGAWQLISLEEAIDRYQCESRSAQWPGDPIAGEFYWRDSWFPFAAASQDVLFLDTAEATSDVCAPVRFRASENWRYWDVPQAPSLADGVGMWVRALREGYFVWDPDAGEQGEWVHHRVRPLPLNLRNPLITG